MLALVRWAAADDSVIRLMARGSGNAGTETGYFANIKDTSGLLEISKFVNGAYTNIANIPKAFNISTWYWFRFSVNEDQLKCKIWEFGAAEPGWDIETSDSSITDPGWAGIGSNTGDWNYYDWFSLSTNGADPYLPSDVEGCTTNPPTTSALTTIAPTTTLTTAAPTTVLPVSCSQDLDSKINTEISLNSLITKEIDLDGNLCR